MSGSANIPRNSIPNLEKGVAMQAANILQRAQLDMMATKLIAIMKGVKEYAAANRIEGRIFIEGTGEYFSARQAEDLLNEIERISSLTRDEVKAMRAGYVDFPDEKIQAILDRAVNEITDVILGVE